MAAIDEGARKKTDEDRPTGDSATWTIAWAAMEFSKKIVTFIMSVFAVHVLVALAAILTNPEAYTLPMKAFMDSCMPIYLCGVVGYDAKAGMENALKISNQAKQFTSKDEAIG